MVNDLDLVIEYQTGAMYRSLTAGGQVFDTVNNVEQVRINNAPAGTYSVIVYGSRVSSGAKQPFALAITANAVNANDLYQCATFPTAVCPNGCSGSTCLSSGACQCGTNGWGVDCSVSKCSNDCSGNGQCNYATGTCTCGNGFAAPTCAALATPSGNNAPIVSNTNNGGTAGVSAGAVVGIAIASCIFGGFICLVLGFFAAVQYLLWVRDKTKKEKEEEMQNQKK